MMQGFTLVEIMIVVAIIGILAAIAIPNFIQARKNSRSSACINNLKQIEGAVEQYMLNNNLEDYPTEMSKIAGGETKLIKVTPVCPAGGTYTLPATDARAACDKGTSEENDEGETIYFHMLKPAA